MHFEDTYFGIPKLVEHTLNSVMRVVGLYECIQDIHAAVLTVNECHLIIICI